jgi:signal transduction histidine kinase
MRRKQDIANTVYMSSVNLLEEINAQKDLAAAESNELILHPSQVNSVELLQQIAKRYEWILEEMKFVKIDLSSQAIDFESDMVLLRRIIGNLVKRTGRIKSERYRFHWM